MRTRVDFVIAAIDADVMREIRMAEECLRRADSVAQAHARFRRQIAQCAAAAMSNASALAAEMVSMGGTPPVDEMGAPRAESTEECLARAQSLLAHYQRRLAMAESLGLLRLREVFREIVESKRAHLLHAAVVAAAGAHPRQLS